MEPFGLLFLCQIMISIPFSGSKRYSYKNVRRIVEQGGYTAVYEPFGGSCVLSVNLLNDGLVKKAVVNDYDRFFDLYPEYLDLKDKVVEECFKFGIKKHGYGADGVFQYEDDGTKSKVATATLQGEERKFLQSTIAENVPKEYWRYFFLGSNFVYGGISNEEVNRRDIRVFKYFQCDLTTNKQRQYLKLLSNCEVNNLDWLDFLSKYQNDLSQINSLLILDPPYIGTYQRQYEGQFTNEETISLVNEVKDLKCDFIFFNDSQERVEEWLQEFNYEIQLIGNGSVNATRNRKDVMAYVKNR